MSDRGEDRHDDPMAGAPVPGDPLIRLRTALDRIAFALERRKSAPPPEPQIAEPPAPEPQTPPPGPDLREVVARIDEIMAGIREVLSHDAVPPAAEDNRTHAEETNTAETNTTVTTTAEKQSFAPAVENPEGSHSGPSPETAPYTGASFTEDPYQNSPPAGHNPPSSEPWSPALQSPEPQSAEPLPQKPWSPEPRQSESWSPEPAPQEPLSQQPWSPEPQPAWSPPSWTDTDNNHTHNHDGNNHNAGNHSGGPHSGPEQRYGGEG